MQNFIFKKTKRIKKVIKTYGKVVSVIARHYTSKMCFASQAIMTNSDENLKILKMPSTKYEIE